MTPKAIRPLIVEQDLAEIMDFLGRGDPQSALRFAKAVEMAISRLAEMPYLGGEVEFDHPLIKNLRVWSIRSFENYLVFYQPHREGIRIVRVLHGARDYARLLG